MVQLRSAPIALALLLGAGSVASAQSVLYTVEGDTKNDGLGSAVSGTGDVDDDGFDDVIVGVPFDDSPAGGGNHGAVLVLSGVDGSILIDLDGNKANDHFGSAVSCAGDVNGDGLADWIAGAPLADINGGESGTAEVFLDTETDSWYQFTGDAAGDRAGFAVAGAGDVNGDGLDDLIVGAPWDDDFGSLSGSARVYSGLDGSVLWTFHGSAAGDRLGSAVDGAGDVDADGHDDLIVGAYLDDGVNGVDAGSASVYSGADGSVLYAVSGNSSTDRLGWSVAGAGDVDRDGFADFIVGAPWDANSGGDFHAGRALVFSGADGSVLYDIEGLSPEDELGSSVDGAGDVNGDGFADLIVGAPLDDASGVEAGSARIISGANGDTLTVWHGDAAGNLFGCSVSAAGDVDADGFADLIVGASGADSGGLVDAGRARVFSGCDRIGSTYCSPAEQNSTGEPAQIRACGSTAVAENRFNLSASQLPRQQFGYFLASETPDFIQNPGGSQGNLCLGGTIGRFTSQIRNSGPHGIFGITVDLTDMPPPAQQIVLPGETWNFQAWFRDKNPQATSNFTDAVSVVFG